ncbi:SPRY domain-containing protein 3-like isoform X2 [Argiope bruennichi]|uniref:SPRY domain-containing protein 3-like isoform X2 n=1 Tax=Argiope bruennichi TaxID=94029 RepID=UPI0024954B78|nr:SPRY domain-containing protein 3-like isoform X2 [Argiope bruennichi]
MDGVLQRHTSRLYGRALFERLCEHMKQVRQERVAIDGDLISYAPDEFGNVGMYVAAEPLTPERNYFEIEIVDPGVENNIVVGLVSAKHPLDQYPGWIPDSVGYHVGDGSLYRDAPKGVAFGPMCEAGDHIGVGIKLDSSASQNNKQNYCVVFFTNNGKEFGSTICSNTTGALYPAVGFHSTGEEVRLSLDMRWMPEEDMSMCIDSNEEEWSRLHDIKLNGTDYPKYRHPGWNKGSIAYHADDGKIFVGSGVGDPFGPRCHKGDIMGCGIIFPRDFVSFYDCDLDSNAPSSVNLDLEEDFSGSYSESEDEEWWKEKENIETGLTIQVFFTRNGKTVGQKEVCIPKGGFYPTVGMLSSDERVKVDLHPLTG